jgi:Inner membrane component of T3SS, cytoplasmic domain/zinc-ribbon domain
MICTSCGSSIPKDAETCSKCGKAVAPRLGDGTRLSETRLESVSMPTKIYAPTDLGKTLLYSAAEEQIKPLMGWLVITEGNEQWKEFRLPLEEVQLLIGNSEECFVHLKDDSLDPRHASLRVKDEKVFLTDLDSSCGTCVNGGQITKVELKDSDEIKVGSTILRFRRF